jgi:hypothetical protein
LRAGGAVAGEAVLLEHGRGFRRNGGWMGWTGGARTCSVDVSARCGESDGAEAECRCGAARVSMESVPFHEKIEFIVCG